MDRKPRSDKGIKRVAHSGYDRIYTFKFNAMLDSSAVESIDNLISQYGNIKDAIRFLLTGDKPVMNVQSVDEKLNRIIVAIDMLGAGTKGKVSAKQKANVID